MRRRTIFRCVPRGRGRCGGFTPIELLVVISIIALLMAVLLPAAGRVRNQAKTVACQARLRGWGLVYATYLTEDSGPDPFKDLWGKGDWYRLLRPYCSDSNDMLLCPMATRYKVNPNNPYLDAEPGGSSAPGSKYTAWRCAFNRIEQRALGGSFYGSYGMNTRIAMLYARPKVYYFYPAGKRRQAPLETPVLLDCISTASSANRESDGPPAYDGEISLYTDLRHFCIDRHDGAINSLLWNGAVRKIGLKELWTLRWSPDFDTANRWTKAGGVQPEDWPEWMKGFKDY